MSDEWAPVRELADLAARDNESAQRDADAKAAREKRDRESDPHWRLARLEEREEALEAERDAAIARAEAAEKCNESITALADELHEHAIAIQRKLNALWLLWTDNGTVAEKDVPGSPQGGGAVSAPRVPVGSVWRPVDYGYITDADRLVVAVHGVTLQWASAWTVFRPFHRKHLRGWERIA